MVKMKGLQRMLAFVLMLGLLVGLVPLAAYAADPTTPNTNVSGEAANNIQLYVYSGANESGVEAPLAGAKFQVYLKSAGSYDAADTNSRALLVTDENGFAQTGPLPVGIYTVHHIEGGETSGYVDFDVNGGEPIKEDSTYVYLLNDVPYMGYLKIVKVDKETGKVIPMANTEFKLFDADKNAIYMTDTYPEKTTYKTFKTDSTGVIYTPQQLGVGDYYIQEVTAPEGYVLDTGLVKFTVSKETLEQDDFDKVEDVDADGNPVIVFYPGPITVIPVYSQDMPQKGTITVTKTGEVFSSVTTSTVDVDRMDDLAGLKAALEDAQRFAEDSSSIEQPGPFKFESAYITITTTAGFGSENGSYTIKLVQSDGEAGSTSNTYTYTAPIGAKITLSGQDINGYTLNEGKSVLEATVASSGSTELVLCYENDAIAKIVEDNALDATKFFSSKVEDGEEAPKADAEYTVQVEIETADGAISAEKVVASATVGSTIKVEPQEIHGYTVESKAENLSAVLAADGSTVITIRYKSDATVEDPIAASDIVAKDVFKTVITAPAAVSEEVPYSITLQINNGNMTVSEKVITEKGKVGQTVTLTPVSPLFGYKYVPERSTASLTLASEGKNEMKMYFVKTENSQDYVNQKQNLTLHKAVFSNGAIAGATYDIFAAEDIYTPDGSLRYSKNQKVDTVVTGEDGKAKSKELYLGKYMVQEVQAPAGYVLNTEQYPAELTYAGQTVNVTNTDVDAADARQKAIVSLTKTLEQGGELEKILAAKADGNVEDVIFGLYAAEELTAKNGKTIPANGLVDVIYVKADGTAESSADIPMGKYYVQEIASSDSYLINDTKYPFTFDGSDTANETARFVLNDGKAIANELGHGHIIINKVDNKTDKKPLTGATFAVYRDVNKDNVYTDGTDTLYGYMGEITEGTYILDVPQGVWVVKELAGPDGYKADTESYPAIVEDEDLTYVCNNITAGVFTDEENEVVLTATENGTKTTLAGAELIIRDKDGKEYKDVTTDENGKVTMNKVPAGTYTFTEKKAPAGYKLDKAVHTFTVNRDGTVSGDTNVPHDPIVVVLRKSDASTNEPMSGVEFTVKDASGKEVFKGVTDENGEVKIAKLVSGTYSAIETAAPDGYAMIKEPFIFVVEEDGSVTGATELKNKPIEITIYKVDEKTNAALPGAEFTIYNEDGTVYKTGITDEKGELVISKIPFGNYTYKETAAPEGYELNETEFKLTISDDGTVAEETVVRDAKKDGTLTITVADQLTGYGLEGAEVTIYNEKAEVVTTAVTDKAGLVVLENVPHGKYLFKETKAPAGYILNAGVFACMIDDNGIMQGDSMILNTPISVTITKTDAETKNPVQGAVITLYEAPDIPKADVPEEKDASEDTAENTETVANETVPTESAEGTDDAGDTPLLDENANVAKDSDTSTSGTESKTGTTDNANMAAEENPFIVNDYDTSELTVVGQYTTNERGEAEISPLPDGTYVFKETSAPEGYKLNTNIYKFIVDKEGNVRGIVDFTDEPIKSDDPTNPDDPSNPDDPVNPTPSPSPSTAPDNQNEPDHAEGTFAYTLKKVDTDNTSKAVKNATFTFYTEDGKPITESVLGTATQSASQPAVQSTATGNGVIMMNTDQVLVKATAFDASYKSTDGRPGKALTLMIQNKTADTINAKFSNVLVNGVKCDLPGAESGSVAGYTSIGYRIYWYDEDLTKGGISNIVTLAMHVDAYKVSDNTRISEADTAMNISDVVKNAVTSTTNTTQTQTSTASTANVSVYKTDANGNIKLYLKPGKYFVKETAAPAGYKTNDQTYSFEISSTGAVSGAVTFTNTSMASASIATAKNADGTPATSTSISTAVRTGNANKIMILSVMLLMLIGAGAGFIVYKKRKIA